MAAVVLGDEMEKTIKDRFDLNFEDEDYLCQVNDQSRPPGRQNAYVCAFYQKTGATACFLLFCKLSDRVLSSTDLSSTSSLVTIIFYLQSCEDCVALSESIFAAAGLRSGQWFSSRW